MDKNSRAISRDEQLPRFASAHTDVCFYIYENFAPGSFGVIKQIPLTYDSQEYVKAIEKQLESDKNGEQIVASASQLDRVLKILASESRRHKGNNAYDIERGADWGDGILFAGEQTSDRVGNDRESNRDKRKGVDSDEQHSLRAQKPFLQKYKNVLDYLDGFETAVNEDRILYWDKK